MGYLHLNCIKNYLLVQIHCCGLRSSTKLLCECETVEFAVTLLQVQWGKLHFCTELWMYLKLIPLLRLRKMNLLQMQSSLLSLRKCFVVNIYLTYCKYSTSFNNVLLAYCTLLCILYQLIKRKCFEHLLQTAFATNA